MRRFHVRFECKADACVTMWRHRELRCRHLHSSRISSIPFHFGITAESSSFTNSFSNRMPGMTKLIRIFLQFSLSLLFTASREDPALKTGLFFSYMWLTFDTIEILFANQWNGIISFIWLRVNDVVQYSSGWVWHWRVCVCVWSPCACMCRVSRFPLTQYQYRCTVYIRDPYSTSIQHFDGLDPPRRQYDSCSSVRRFVNVVIRLWMDEASGMQKRWAVSVMISWELHRLQLITL